MRSTQAYITVQNLQRVMHPNIFTPFSRLLQARQETTQEIYVNVRYQYFHSLLCYENTSTCFSKDAESVTYGCVLWCSQIVCIRPYSLNTTTAFYFVTDCSNIAMFVWWRVMPQRICILPGLDQFRNWRPTC